ncbi:uncharacterized protein LOC113493016 [Trichoplusia ni]|uniref:Uncharacterized protein LOC113493016 n=1 Tax=Trichoplusia ni TaxID=7111 RepID=A0A7E5VEA8_TRINI|nr:uncharacterized protein LOC113493016 [Trichoplusia ni]
MRFPCAIVDKMTSTIKCVSCNIVIDELLAYVQNKISIADEASLVKICASAFSSEQIQKSNTLLIESLSSDVRRTVRKGKGKDNRVLNDIVAIFKTTEPDLLPVFVARDLEKLPPITFDHLDVSKLLKDLVLVQAEINNIKSTYVTQSELQNLKAVCEMNFSALPNPNVNTERGAQYDKAIQAMDKCSIQKAKRLKTNLGQGSSEILFQTPASRYEFNGNSEETIHAPSDECSTDA